MNIYYHCGMNDRYAKLKVILIHVFLWVCYGIIVFYWLSFVFNEESATILTLRILVLHAFLFYINTNLLLPSLVERGKYIYYIFSLIICVEVVFLVSAFSNEWPVFYNIFTQLRPFHSREFGFQRHFFFIGGFSHILSSIAVLFISTIYWTITQNRKKKQWELSLLNENLETEMKFLKSQINPHFLFNALNNIYSLSVTKSDKAPGMIMKLSEMLRYMLYESNNKKVPLGKEISYMQNYIDFQVLKIEGRPNIMVDYDNVDQKLKVEPMLFIPFIENSFKHSNIEDLEHGLIAIKLETDGDKINFKIRNSIPGRKYTKDASGGIGLQNIRKRLELLYPGKYELNIHQNEKTFSVQLTIDTR